MEKFYGYLHGLFKLESLIDLMCSELIWTAWARMR